MQSTLTIGLDNSNTTVVVSQDVAPQSSTSLLFSGATSVLGGANYQMGQLVHTVTILNGASTVSVAKTNPTTDVDISSFQTTGTVSTNASATFTITARGRRNGAASTLQGFTTDDCIGINGGNPGKIDIFNDNKTEEIEWEVAGLDAGLTLSIKTIHLIRANYSGTSRPMIVVVPFNPLGLSAGYTINAAGANVFSVDVSPNVDHTSLPTTATFKTGIDETVAGGGNVGYGIYAIDFDVTG